MDLVAGAKRVVVAMEHVAKDGSHKLLEKCTLPLTGVGCIQRIVTDYGVLDPVGNGFRLLEFAPDLSPDDVVKATGARVELAPTLKPIKI
jgi:3-oxoacid CoA-transferase subunit B